MAITDDWRVWIGELSKTRKVIAIRNAGPRAYSRHQTRSILRKSLRRCGRAVDYLRSQAGYHRLQFGGGVAMQCAIRHSEKVRKVVSISARSAADGWVKEANDFGDIHVGNIQRHSMEAEYKRLSPTPEKFRILSITSKRGLLRPYDFAPTNSRPPKRRCFSSTRCRRCTARSYRGNVPDEGGRRIHGDMQTALGIEIGHLADTTHVTLMNA